MKTIYLSVVLAVTSLSANAQTGKSDPTPGNPGVGGGGLPAPAETGAETAADLNKSETAPGKPGMRPARPVLSALDKNMDGELSAEEIAAAATTLMSLDLNKDGKLTRDELMPGGENKTPGAGGAGGSGTPGSGTPGSTGGADNGAGSASGGAASGGGTSGTGSGTGGADGATEQKR